MKEMIKGAEDYAARTECKGCLARNLPTCRLTQPEGSPCDEYQRAVEAWKDGYMNNPLTEKVKEMQGILDLNDRIVQELRSQIKEMEKVIKFFNAADTEEAINEACHKLEEVLK